MKQHAFTLLESIIVLIIVVAFALIPITQFGPLKQYQVEQLFFHHFDQEWRYVQAHAVLQQEKVQIRIYKEYVNFRIIDGKTVASQRKLWLPPGMQADVQGIMIDSSGHTGPKSIHFHSHYFNRITTIKPQMGWGIYE